MQQTAMSTMQQSFSDVNIVTDAAEPSPEVRFNYVFIPADINAPMEEREMVRVCGSARACAKPLPALMSMHDARR